MASDLILYHNATIVTLDDARPRAGAMLTSDGRITAIGELEDLSSIAAGANRVDLGNGTVVAGFNDCHMHVLSMGLGLNQLDLQPEVAPTIDEICSALAARATNIPDGAWLLARGYNQNLLHERRHPTHVDLDPVTGGHPTVVWHTSGHVMAVNTPALAAAGITAGTRDPDGGEIERDSSGTPTGVLKENAMHLMRAAIPAPTSSQARQAILAASAVLSSEGVTSATDAATGQTLPVDAEAAAYRDAFESGGLKTRLTLMPVIEKVVDRKMAPESLNLGRDPAWLDARHAKIFTDGALTTRTAAMRAPYVDTGSHGILTWEWPDLLDHGRRALALGWRLASHAIGDRAVQQVLDLYAALGTNLDRARIEHATICDHDQIGAMRDLGVTVVLQPEDIAVLGDAYPSGLGSERAANNSPVGWFAEAGVHTAFSSDRPVTPGHPLVGIRAAVERRTASGIAFRPELHGISAEGAIHNYSRTAAYSTCDESWKGYLAPGMAADFVVLDRDITSCRSEDIVSARILKTVVAGRLVFQSG